MKKAIVYVEDIAFAMEKTLEGQKQYIDLATGRIIRTEKEQLPEDAGAEDGDGDRDGGTRYLWLPSRFDIQEYEIMEKFAYSSPHPEHQEILLQALQGRKPLRNFRERVKALGILDVYLSYRLYFLLEIAMKWCGEHGIPFGARTEAGSEICEEWEKKTLRIALLQILPMETMEENREKGIAYCRKAKSMGADIVLFPEMWSVGYHIPKNIAKCKKSAVPADGEFVRAFQELAKELELAIGITIMEKHEPLPRNSLCLIDRNGKIPYVYSKIHMCDFGEECRLDAGDDFYVADLDTPKGIVKVGSMICFDREFPESARILMLKGAELILVPNACPMEINRLAQLQGRAYENMLAIATCNYPEGQPDCNGHSTVFDGVAYLPDRSGSRNTCILEASEEEGLYMAELDLDMLRAYRRREVHGNAYRHPKKYSLLVREGREEPFIRGDYRGTW